MKFKVGDKVKVKPWGRMSKEYGIYPDGSIDCEYIFIEDMKHFCRKILTIEKIVEEHGYYKMKEDDGMWKWSDEMLEETEQTMKDNFTKADLKDGMVLTTEDGRKAVRVSGTGYYVKDEDIKFSNGAIITDRTGKDQRVCKIEYGDEVVWEQSVKRMTAEEMRVKLEELTGEKIEIAEEPSINDMRTAISKHCDGTDDCRECQFYELCPLSYECCDDKKFIRYCYEELQNERKGNN